VVPAFSQQFKNQQRTGHTANRMYRTIRQMAALTITLTLTAKP